MSKRSGAWFPSLLIALALTLVACGGDDDDDGEAQDGGADATPTAESAGEAPRPDWFPEAFPLFRGTEIVREEQRDGGGTVQFRMPVPFTQAIVALDNNLERNGFTVNERVVGDNTATYRIENDDVTAVVVVTPSEPDSLVDVDVTEK